MQRRAPTCQFPLPRHLACRDSCCVLRPLAFLLLFTAPATAMPWVSFRADQALVSMGAGIEDFPGAEVRAHPRLGSAWDLRFTFGARARFAFEAEYAGSYSPVKAEGAAPYLVGNGVSGIVRFNFGPWAFQPFVFVGVGFHRLELHARGDNPTAAAPFASASDNFLLPVGAGFDVTFVRHLNFDLRVSYRPLFGSALLEGSDARADQFSVATHVGYAF